MRYFNNRAGRNIILLSQSFGFIKHRSYPRRFIKPRHQFLIFPDFNDMQGNYGRMVFLGDGNGQMRQAFNGVGVGKTDQNAVILAFYPIQRLDLADMLHFSFRGIGFVCQKPHPVGQQFLMTQKTPLRQSYPKFVENEFKIGSETKRVKTACNGVREPAHPSGYKSVPPWQTLFNP